jgi:hypothetical protein
MSTDNGSNYREKIEALLAKHIGYFDHMTWPQPGTEEYDDMLRTWCEAFGEKRYSPNVVARACLAIRKKPPTWKPDHLPELLRLIEDQQADSGGRAAINTPDDPAALACPHCEGTGMATMFRDDYGGLDSERVVNGDGTTRIVWFRITAPCTCPKGRRIWSAWIQDKVKSADLASMPRGWSFEDPTGLDAPLSPLRSGVD